MDYGDVIYMNSPAFTLKLLNAVYHSTFRFISGDGSFFEMNTNHCDSGITHIYSLVYFVFFFIISFFFPHLFGKVFLGNFVYIVYVLHSIYALLMYAFLAFFIVLCTQGTYEKENELLSLVHPV